jgi:hypothetical protein
VEWDGGHYYKTRRNPFRILFWFSRILAFYFSPLIAVAFLGASLVSRGLKMRLTLAGIAVLTLALLMEKLVTPHYFAPAIGLVLIPVMFSVRWLRIKAQRFGPALVLLFVAAIVGADLFAIAQAQLEVNTSRRDTVNKSLMKRGGSHIVMVRYSPNHSVYDEIVYNGADIDHAVIIWARDMGDAGNRELIDYYPGRQIWLFEPDATPPALSPYPGVNAPTGDHQRQGATPDRLISPLW